MEYRQSWQGTKILAPVVCCFAAAAIMALTQTVSNNYVSTDQAFPDLSYTHIQNAMLQLYFNRKPF